MMIGMVHRPRLERAQILHLDASGRPHHTREAALIDEDGAAWWYRHGQLHRDDGPAVVSAAGLALYWAANDTEMTLPEYARWWSAEHHHPLDEAIITVIAELLASWSADIDLEQVHAAAKAATADPE